MAKKNLRRRQTFFKKKDVGIPYCLNAQETLDTPCHLCGGEIIYTENKIIFNENKGLGVCYYCTGCEAMTSCHKKKEKLKDGTYVHSPMGIVAGKEMRQLRLRCHQLLDVKWRINRTMKRSTAYHKLAIGMGIPYNTCHISWMNEEQLLYALDVLMKTPWTKNRFE